MRWPLAFVLGLSLTAGLSGCRNANKCDQVESELRAREEDVRHLKSELDRAEFYNQSLARELAAVRGEPGPTGLIEKPSERYPVRSIRLGRGTAGRAADCGGDDALQVQVEPIDCEGQAIKAPGCLYIEILEISKEGLKRPLSSWEVAQDDLRRKWQNGLFNTGYMLTFPWKTPPTTEKLRVLARLTLIDGRVFEADKDITVRLLPEHIRRVQPILPSPAPTPDTTFPPPTPSPIPIPTPGPTTIPTPGPTTIPPGPVEVLPPPTMSVPLPPTKPGDPPPPTPPSGSPASLDGPRLIRGTVVPGKPRVQLLRPIPMPIEP